MCVCDGVCVCIQDWRLFPPKFGENWENPGGNWGKIKIFIIKDNVNYSTSARQDLQNTKVTHEILLKVNHTINLAINIVITFIKYLVLYFISWIVEVIKLGICK